MYPLELPDLGLAGPLSFGSLAEAGIWLGRQPQTQPQQMLAVLQKAIAALDASHVPPTERLDILDLLRRAVIQAQTAIQARFTRKALPLFDGDAEIFSASRRLWRTLAIAYLRTVSTLPAQQAVRPLHRATVALLQEQYAHFLAAWELPGEVLQLLYGILAAAESLGQQHTPLADPEFKHLGESHIAGQVAWAFLLQFIDPYRLSLAQLTVANRAFRRWRELAAFRAKPDVTPQGRTLPLAALVDSATPIVEGLAWLDVRPITRKLRSRIEALEKGEAPETLNLGRELSSQACIRLLSQLNDALQPNTAAKDIQTGDLRLVFEAGNIYALLAGKRLASSNQEPAKRSVDHQRLALFGFDNRLTPSLEPARVEVPGEAWQAAEGFVSQKASSGQRLLVPCLAAQDKGLGQDAVLGVLANLQMTAKGELRGRIQWYPGPIRAVQAKLPSMGGAAMPVPVFVLGRNDEELSLILPTDAPVRCQDRLVLDGEPSMSLILGQVIERGSDFVRYSTLPA